MAKIEKKNCIINCNYNKKVRDKNIDVKYDTKHKNTKYWRGEEKNTDLLELFELTMNTQTLQRKEHKHITKENHQTTGKKQKGEKNREVVQNPKISNRMAVRTNLLLEMSMD